MDSRPAPLPIGAGLFFFASFVLWEIGSVARSDKKERARIFSCPLHLCKQTQNANRNANCMNRGVVRVCVYFPNCVGSNDNDGCAKRTS